MYLCTKKCVYHLIPAVCNSCYNAMLMLAVFISLYYSVRSRVIMAFQEKDGFDVAFFIMYTFEYIYKDERENDIYISLLDSAQYFAPDGLRTQVYQKIIIGYLRYARDNG